VRWLSIWSVPNTPVAWGGRLVERQHSGFSTCRARPGYAVTVSENSVTDIEVLVDEVESEVWLWREACTSSNPTLPEEPWL